MATLYPSAADGTILRALLSDSEEQAYPAPPAGAGAPLAFDPATNGALVADLRRSTDAYRIVGGTLQKNGQPVTIAADDPVRVERTAATSDLITQYAAAVTALDAIIARNGTFTLAQAGSAIDTLARIQKRVLRLMKAQVS